MFGCAAGELHDPCPCAAMSFRSQQENDCMTSLLLRGTGVTLLVAAPLFLGACDSTTSDGAVTVEGRVTTNQTYGQSGNEVADATVTAENVAEDGGTQEQEGSAQTDASGRYVLDLDGASDVVLVTATDGSDFTSKTLVYMNGRSSAIAGPITTESDVEAEVYLEAKSQDSEDAVSVADIAAYVTQEVAARVKAGGATAAQVAAAIRAAAEAEAEYVREEAGSEAAEEIATLEGSAYAELQAELNAAQSTDAAGEAVSEFEAAIVQAYEKTNVAAEVAAQAQLAARAALLKSSNNIAAAPARFELRKRSEVFVALTSAHAIEATMRAHNAASASIEAVQQAGETLAADIRAAADVEAIATAYASYEDVVEQELAAELEVAVALLDAAQSGAGPALSVLEAAVAAAPSAVAIAELYATFFVTSQTSIAESFSGDANAELAATVLALLLVQ